jgi:Asp/Glu/hydantoin racemase
MAKDLSDKTLGVIHAGTWVAATGARFHEMIMPEAKLLHICDDTLMDQFLQTGPGIIPEYNFYRVATYARFLQDTGADLVMLGCSTMGPSVPIAEPMVDVPMLNIDWPMMQKAVRDGPRVGLICTLDTTVPSSTSLLQRAIAEAGTETEIVQLFSEEAFQALRRGNQEKHDRILLDLIAAHEDDLDAIVLAQLSMSVLDDRTHGQFAIPVYNSGREGWTRAREILEASA